VQLRSASFAPNRRSEAGADLGSAMRCKACGPDLAAHELFGAPHRLGRNRFGRAAHRCEARPCVSANTTVRKNRSCADAAAMSFESGESG
jgi:hypothetical protein